MKLQAPDQRFNELYDRTYRRTAAFLTARCPRLSDVEDLLQETYLAVYRILCTEGWEHIENEEAYVLSAARSRLTDWYRRQGRERERFLLPSEQEQDDAWLAGLPDRGPSPEEQAVHRELLDAVSHLVRKKGEAQQQAFYLHHCFGASFSEIARLQGRNEVTVRSGVFRMTQEIRKKLERSPL